MTLHDVAREAGVSLATASRSLNGSQRKVAEEYRVRVVAAAQRLGYSPNLSAQAVAKGSTSTVALIVSDIADPYFSTIASGVAGAAEELGLVVTMAVTGRDPARELAVVRALRGARPRVMILAGSRFAGEDEREALVAELRSFEDAGGRVVLISQGGLPFPTVVLDNRAGARALAEALVGQGYRRFGVVAGSPAILTSHDRVQGFREGLEAHGIALAHELVVEAPFSRDGGFDGATRLLAAHRDELDLVFAVSDVMAMGVSSALREAGLEPGADIGVAGFDDIPTVRDVHPALTTVAVPLRELGERSLAVALGDDDAPAEPVATSVVLRASTPGPRAT